MLTFNRQATSRHLVPVALVVLLALTGPMTAQATLLLYDGMDYTTTPDPQSLGDQAFNGTAHASLGGITLDSGGAAGTDENGHLRSGSLTSSGLQASTGNRASFRDGGTGDYNSNTKWGFGTQQAETGSYFVSFLFEMNDLGNLSTNGPGGNDDTWIKFGDVRWEGGIRLNSSDSSQFDLTFGSVETVDNYTPGTSGLSLDTTYLLVFELDFDNDRARVWVNPSSLGGFAPTADLDASGPGSGRPFEQVTFYTGISDEASDTEVSEYHIDELRVGTTFADVTPTGAAPPGDTDGDGIPDDWETLYFGGPTNAVADAVSSNEVNTVLETYILGLSPLDPDAYYLVTNSVVPGMGGVLSWTSLSNRTYAVERSTNLLTGFDLLIEGLPATTDAYQVEAEGYYRVGVSVD